MSARFQLSRGAPVLNETCTDKTSYQWFLVLNDMQLSPENDVFIVYFTVHYLVYFFRFPRRNEFI